MKQSSQERSRIMRRVKSRDTTPELLVRCIAHRLGYRFRLCRKDLPGCPDLVFPRLHKIIFVHGCFWHGHDCARGARVPKQNRAYWQKKVSGNQIRDERNLQELTLAGWKVLTIWECDVRDEPHLKNEIQNFLNGMNFSGLVPGRRT